MMTQTGELRWQAEMHHLKGALLLHQATPDVAQAECGFLHAHEVARNQQARSLELRAATSLAKSW